MGEILSNVSHESSHGYQCHREEVLCKYEEEKRG